MQGVKGFGDHGAFVPGDIRPAGTAKIKNARRIHSRLRRCEIPSHKTAHVFSEGNAKIAGALTSASLCLGLESNLGT